MYLVTSTNHTMTFAIVRALKKRKMRYGVIRAGVLLFDEGGEIDSMVTIWKRRFKDEITILITDGVSMSADSLAKRMVKEAEDDVVRS